MFLEDHSLKKEVNRAANILLIGMGHQAKGTYLAAFSNLKNQYNLNLLAIVDL